MKNKLNKYYWESLAKKVSEEGYYAKSTILGKYKRDFVLDVIRNWNLEINNKIILKTDLFEEAFGPDEILFSISRDYKPKRVYGIDISNRVIAKVKNNCIKKTPNKKIILQNEDLKKLSFKDNYFDLIISQSTLDHFEDLNDLNRVMKELYRVLKSRGKLLFSINNKHNFLFYLIHEFQRIFRLMYVYSSGCFTRNQLKIITHKGGFKFLNETAVYSVPPFARLIYSYMESKKINLINEFLEKLINVFKKLDRSFLRFYTGWYLVFLVEKK